MKTGDAPPADTQGTRGKNMNEKQREQIKKMVEDKIEFIESHLNDYLIDNVLTQIEGVELTDLNALDQAQNTFLKLMTGGDHP
jgi:hypothetical protein